MRPPIEVRPASPQDMEHLVALCVLARQESVVGPQVCTDDPAVITQQLGALTAHPGGTLLVARADEVVLGFLLGRVLGPNLFTDEVILAVEAVYVAPEHRRRGAGHALMLGATEVAERVGAVHVYAAPIPGARGMQRFFVQLGFTPAASHRVASTTALHRRLTVEAGSVRRPGPRNIEDLIALRRQARLSLVTGTASAGRPEQKGQGTRSSISRHVKRAVQTRRDLGSATTIS